MRDAAWASGAAFVVGFGGWLAASIARVDGWWPFAILVVLGFVAGGVSRRPVHLLSLWLGILAAYPVALALGIIAFFGEGLDVLLPVFLVAAASGFAAGLAVTRWATANGRTRGIDAP